MVSIEFRDLSSDALNADYRRAPGFIRRLLDFVEGTPLLADFVHASPWTGDPPLEHLRAVTNTRSRISLPRRREDEVPFLHELLQSLAGMTEDEMRAICFFYSGKSSVQDATSALLHDAVGAYAACLRREISRVLLSATPYDSGRRVEVMNTGNGLQQVVVHQGDGAVTASQTMDAERRAVGTAAEELLAVLAGHGGADLAPEEVEELREVATVAQQESSKARPSRWALGRAKEFLDTIVAAKKAGDAVAPAVTRLAEAIPDLIASIPA